MQEQRAEEWVTVWGKAECRQPWEWQDCVEVPCEVVPHRVPGCSLYNQKIFPQQHLKEGLKEDIELRG